MAEELTTGTNYSKSFYTNNRLVYESYEWYSGSIPGLTFSIQTQGTWGSETVKQLVVTGVPKTAGTYNISTGGTTGGLDTFPSPFSTTIQFVVTGPSYYTHTIYYNGNGGSGSMSPTVITDTNDGNTNVPLAQNGFTAPTEQRFAHWDVWIDDPPELVGSYNPGQSVGVPGDEHFTAHAVWEADTYTVTFDANGGQLNGSSTKTVTYGSTYGELPTASKDGYYFSGWYTDPSGGSYVQASTIVTTAANHTLYAHYGQTTHTIKYYSNGGSGSMSDSVVTDGNLGASPVTLKANEFVRPGYAFTHWDILLPDSDEKVSEKMPGQTVNVASRSYMRAVAAWTPLYDHTIVYYSNGGSGDMSHSVVTDTNSGNTAVTLKNNGFTRAGYHFAYWGVWGGDPPELVGSYNPGQSVDVPGDEYFTARAMWEGNTYTVTFDANGGQLNGSSTKTVTYGLTYGELPTASKDNYYFSGWYTDPSGGSYVEATTRVETMANHTLYAHYGQATHTIKYFGGYNDVQGEMSDSVVTDGNLGSSPVTLKANGFTRTGYVFSHWDILLPDRDQKVDEKMPGQTVNVASGSYMRAFAEWTPTYTVTWKNWDGTTLETDYNVPQYTIPTYNGATPTKPDHTFHNYTIGTYTFSTWSPAVNVVTADVTYTAQFTETKLVYTYNDQDSYGNTGDVYYVLFNDGRFIMFADDRQGASADYITIVRPSPWAIFKDDITSVTIESGVTAVGDFNFFNSNNLTTVSIADTVATLGTQSFGGCEDITDLTIPVSTDASSSHLSDSEAITKVTFTYGSNGEWYNYSSASKVPTYGSRNVLSDITIASGVKSIGAYAFYECPEITMGDLPETVTSIGDHAFYGCTGVVGDISDDLTGKTSLGVGAFENCTGISSTLTIPSTLSINAETFKGCVGISAISIPSTMAIIPNSAFRGCTSIQTLDLPSTVTSVGAYAFADCTGITMITLRSNVLTLGTGAFQGASSVSAMYLLNSKSGFTCNSNTFAMGTSITPVVATVYSSPDPEVPDDDKGWAAYYGNGLTLYKNNQTSFVFISTSALHTVVFMSQNDPGQSGGYITYTTLMTDPTQYLPAMPAPPTNSNGYTFAGWSTQATGPNWVEVVKNTKFEAQSTTVYARWTDDAAFSAVFVLKPGLTLPNTQGSTIWDADIGSFSPIETVQRTVGNQSVTYWSVVKWRYHTNDPDILSKSVTFTTPTDAQIVFPDGMEEHLKSPRWYSLAPYQPMGSSTATLVLDRANQDSSYSNTFYPSWEPAPSTTGGRAVLCAPGWLPLDLGEIQSVSKQYRSNLTVMPIMCYGYERTFAIDLGTSVDVSLGYIRVEPPEADDDSSDSRDWTNSKWLGYLRSLMNRWQMKTNGQTFYLLNPAVSQDRWTTTAFKEMKDVNCYISSAPVAYSSMGPHAISGSIALQIGTLYPKKETPAMKKITFALGGSYADKWSNYIETMETYYPELGLVVLPGYDIWGSAKVEWDPDTGLPSTIYGIGGWRLPGESSTAKLHSPGEAISVSLISGTTPTITAITTETVLGTDSIKYLFGPDPATTRNTYSGTFTVVPDEDAPDGRVDVGFILVGGGGGGSGSRTIRYKMRAVPAAHGGIPSIYNSGVIVAGAGGAGGNATARIGGDAYTIFGQQVFSYTLGAGGAGGSARVLISDDSYLDTSGGTGGGTTIGVVVNGKVQIIAAAQGGAGGVTVNQQQDESFISKGGVGSDVDTPVGGDSGYAKYVMDDSWVSVTASTNGQVGSDGIAGSGGSASNKGSKDDYTIITNTVFLRYQYWSTGAGGGGGQNFIPVDLLQENQMTYSKGNAGAVKTTGGTSGINGGNATFGCGGGGGGCSIDAGFTDTSPYHDQSNMSNGTGGTGGRGFIIVYAVGGTITGENLMPSQSSTP